MNWMQNLYDTAIAIEKLDLPTDSKPWPVSHVAKKAHIEISISIKGELQNIKALAWNEAVTIIPATEGSANRTNGIAPHPLCEELGYCAKDLPDGDIKKYLEMKDLMEQWIRFDGHPKVKAVYTYLENGKVYSDLINNGFIPFKSTGPKGKATPIDDRKIFIRWRINEINNPCTGTWQDASLIKSWIAFDAATHDKKGFCMVSGEACRIAKSHSRFLRSPDDGAKLVSSNDSSGFTFKGRFTDKKDDYGGQACTVSYGVSQKAHNALRWLISRQGYQKQNNELGECFIAWAVSGKDIPDPFANSYDFLGSQEKPSSESIIGDVGQSFALLLNKKIAGYSTNIDDSENIVLLGLDSATTGCMSITFYRELFGSEFLKRIIQWHSDFAWIQNYGKGLSFVGSPSPKDIAWATYGETIENKNGIKLLGVTMERLLPCITDKAGFPKDISLKVIRRATNRVSFKKVRIGKKQLEEEWEKCLGIACSIYKGTNQERRYRMALEEDRKSRDYLYGRLLAVGEQIESIALYYAKENRDTTAARLMQRFADRPFSTWKTIEGALVPYQGRIKAKAPGLLAGYNEILDDIHFLFVTDEYKSDKMLSGEYLLGYHCQRRWLREHRREKGVWIEKTEVVQVNLDSIEE
jgi:CRISPR-associated protein Csd1